MKKIGKSVINPPAFKPEYLTTPEKRPKLTINKRPQHLIVYTPDIKGAGGVGIYSGKPGYSDEIKDWIWKFIYHNVNINKLGKIRQSTFTSENLPRVSIELRGDAGEIFHKARYTGADQPWYDENLLEYFAKNDVDYKNLKLLKAMLLMSER